MQRRASLGFKTCHPLGIVCLVVEVRPMGHVESAEVARLDLRPH
jgi:hypothetical protein